LLEGASPNLFGSPGRQRTRQEYEALFKNAGLSFEREIDTGADISILEAVPA